MLRGNVYGGDGGEQDEEGGTKEVVFPECILCEQSDDWVHWSSEVLAGVGGHG